jgi:hypothetical protein
MGFKISQEFGGAYLSGPDVPPGQSYRLQAGDVRQESFEDGQTKLVLGFLNARKSLALNKTNASALAAAYGDDTDGWYGRWLELFSVPTQFNGRAFNGLRVRPIEPPPNYRETPDPAPAAAAAPPRGGQPQSQHTPPAAPQGVPATQTRAAMERGHENPDDIPF